MMTTSCCSAYVRAVQIHVPELKECVSSTRSPMHYTAEIARKDDPGCITVFIGPCLAKRREGFDDDIVNYVLSIEEVGALLIAKGIEIASLKSKDDLKSSQSIFRWRKIKTFVVLGIKLSARSLSDKKSR